MRKKIYRAGLIPLCVDYDDFENSLMMFMIPSDQQYGGSDPQIAKGQIESGEEPMEAALREAHEELGLTEERIIDVIDCGTWLGRTHMYVALVDSSDTSKYDKPHFETEQTMWLTNDQFQKQGRDIHRPVVDQLFDLVRATVAY